ncbi:hypothetical protein QBK99_08165 [Corticibacterium sp. UT-5YL-CI-8]|nr:hypothetical protein [Tianweitania sp. UT-5YL-CI-8]
MTDIEKQIAELEAKRVDLLAAKAEADAKLAEAAKAEAAKAHALKLKAANKLIHEIHGISAIVDGKLSEVTDLLEKREVLASQAKALAAHSWAAGNVMHHRQPVLSGLAASGVNRFLGLQERGARKLADHDRAHLKEFAS